MKPLQLLSEILLLDEDKPIFTNLVFCGFALALASLFVKSLQWWLTHIIPMPELTIFGFVMIMILFIVFEMSKRVSTWLGLYMFIGFFSVFNEQILPIVAMIMASHIVIEVLMKELIRAEHEKRKRN